MGIAIFRGNQPVLPVSWHMGHRCGARKYVSSLGKKAFSFQESIAGFKSDLLSRTFLVLLSRFYT